MTIEKYQELTGITVDSSDVARVTAQINRTRIILESLLGYSLKKTIASQNQYEELGKATTDCIFRGIITDIDTLELSAPDQVVGSYRLYSYNKSDAYLKIDPFTQIHAVKLVFLKQGAEPNGITHKTFPNSQMRVHKQGGISKYIERCRECYCLCECSNCMQLAVDADWLNETCLPEELLYLWSEMVSYYADEKNDIKSETLATHSYTKFSQVIPEQLPANISIITKYAGPNGSVSRTIVV
jgi:hypothetical protein